jgi:hypothetical protein
VPLDQFTPLDIEIYETHRRDFAEAVPVKATNLRINGMEVLLPEDANITVQGVGSKSGCATVTMTVFARSVKVFREPGAADHEPVFLDEDLAEPLPEPEPVVDARTATAEELLAVLKERGWHLSTTPQKPFITISPNGGGSITAADMQQFTINAPEGIANFPALVASGTWNDSGTDGIQEITVTGLDKTERLIEAMISHAMDGKRVVYIASRFGKALDVQKDIGKRWIEDDIRIFTAHSNERIKFLRSGGEILFLANSKHSGRGLRADVLVLDGVDATPERLEELRPMLAASKHPYLYQTFNATPVEELQQKIDKLNRDYKWAL